MDLDARVRVAAFNFLAEQTRLLGEVLPRTLLAQGFPFEVAQVRLLGPQGIFKPAVLPELPLTITTVPTVEGEARPYEDEIGADGLILYRYRGTDPDHHENVGLRRAMASQTPLIHFIGVVPGKYMALWPVFIVGDDQANLTFTVAVEDRDIRLSAVPAEDTAETALRRRYVTTATRQHASSVSASCGPTRSTARSAGYGMWSCSRPPTSCQTPIHEGRPLCRTAWHSASSTTPPSTPISSVSGPTTPWTCGSTCWRRSTGRC